MYLAVGNDYLNVVTTVQATMSFGYGSTSERKLKPRQRIFAAVATECHERSLQLAN
jgi:hypothetical protein